MSIERHIERDERRQEENNMCDREREREGAEGLKTRNEQQRYHDSEKRLHTSRHASSIVFSYNSNQHIQHMELSTEKKVLRL